MRGFAIGNGMRKVACVEETSVAKLVTKLLLSYGLLKLTYLI